MSLLTEALSSTHLHGEALLKKGDGTMRGTLQVISTELRTPPTCWGWRRSGTWSDLQVGACWEGHRYVRLIRGRPCRSEEVDCSCSDWAKQSMTRRSPRPSRVREGPLRAPRPAMTDTEVHGGSEARKLPKPPLPLHTKGVQTTLFQQESLDCGPTAAPWLYF